MVVNSYSYIPGFVGGFNYLYRRFCCSSVYLYIVLVKAVEVIDEDDTLDFSKAKTLAIFCNGPWCSQSVAMIEALLEIGYPAEKISWYRGGMQTWLAAGMTSTRD